MAEIANKRSKFPLEFFPNSLEYKYKNWLPYCNETFDFVSTSKRI